MNAEDKDRATPPPAAHSPAGQPDRRMREAEALRANLQRRKAQQRARKDFSGLSPPAGQPSAEPSEDSQG